MTLVNSNITPLSQEIRRQLPFSTKQ